MLQSKRLLIIFTKKKERMPERVYALFTLPIIKVIPHKARLAALHAICLLIFRHIAQKSLARRLRSRQDSAREQRSVALGLIATDSMPAEFLCNLPKNPAAHLTHKLCAVLS